MLHQHTHKIIVLSEFHTKARSPTKKLAKKSVYMPWLICKLITTIEAWFFHCIGPYLSIVQNRL